MTRLEGIMAERPDWWPAWTDYPHGGISEKQARQLSKYCVHLEDRLRYLLALVEAADGMARVIQEDHIWSAQLEALAHFNAVKECKPSTAAPVR